MKITRERWDQIERHLNECGYATAHVRAVASNVQQIVGNSGGDE